MFLAPSETIAKKMDTFAVCANVITHSGSEENGEFHSECYFPRVVGTNSDIGERMKVCRSVEGPERPQSPPADVLALMEAAMFVL